MRIGVDARELCGRPTGVGRYLAGLLGEWATQPQAGQHEFVLYVPETPAVALDRSHFLTRLVPGGHGAVWEQVWLPWAARRDGLGAFFAPGYAAPLTLETPFVVAIHDLSFVAHPEWFRAREGIRRRWMSGRAARRARAVVTISEFSRRELIDRLGIPDGRIHVIPPGVVSTDGSPAARRDPRVLFVGSIFNRRHVPDLIRGFSYLVRAHPEVSLDIVGDNRSYPYEDLPRTIEAEGLNGHVRWHAYVSDADLKALYARARAFAFLSEYEGLGLTPLEALAAGVPPVLLETPVARETCGDAAFYVPGTGSAVVAEALERALFDDQARAARLAAAPGALARYSWPQAAHETLAVIVAADRGHVESRG
jgi:glycosyltransferase involved in cell wall biosynthesis